MTSSFSWCLIRLTLIIAHFLCHNAISESPDDTLSLLIMGDTQYHFMCEKDNVQCKHVSKKCRVKYGLPLGLEDFPKGFVMNGTTRNGQKICIKIEGRFANRVQRQALVQLINDSEPKPAALIINGDLTDFGHYNQISEFKSGWLSDFPIPLLLGLGNHDYQNNINDCALNFCAHAMLSLYVEFTKNRSIPADIRRSTRGLDVSYSGSLAYTERICSSSGQTCAFVIQINNAIDYSVEFSSLFVNWKIKSPMEYLKKELALLEVTGIPILLNMHKCEEIQRHKVRNLIASWLIQAMANQKAGERPPRIGVFFAHMHQNHQIEWSCINGQKVPFVYVGSVPNNRFSMLKFNSTHDSIIGYKARDFLMHEGEVLEQIGEADLWGPCTTTTHFKFVDEATKRRISYIKAQTLKQLSNS